MVVDQHQVKIANFEKNVEESDEDFCNRKLGELGNLCKYQKTLFVIDNYSVLENISKERECFEKIEKLPCKILITTRNKLEDGTCIEVEELSPIAARELFIKELGNDKYADEGITDEAIDDLIK